MPKPDSNNREKSSLSWRLTEGETLVIDGGFIKIEHGGNHRNRTELRVTLPRNLSLKAVAADEAA